MIEAQPNKMPQAGQAIRDVFNAASVAVVGASSEPHKFGYMTLESLIKGGFEGPIYPVNPKADEVQGLKAYPSLEAIPGPVEAVVVIVPAKFVPGVLDQAAAKGAKGVIIQSAGFREAGRPDLEEEILAAARRNNLRLMGPNIQGINYLPNKFCAMFFPVITTRGPLGVVSQSGSVTTALSEWAERDGLGISAAINLGNQTDICEADYLDFLAADPRTKVITMYLEGLKNGPAFLEALARASAQKPVVVLKGGKTATGVKSASSHTGSLAGSHRVFSAACRQFGGLVAPTIESLYDSAKGLACIGRPRGRRLAIISTSGGAATLASDEAESSGLSLPPLSRELVADLKKADLLPLATLANPTDLGSIFAEHYAVVARAMEAHNAADVLLINFADPVPGAAEMIKSLSRELKTPLAVSYMGGGAEEIEAGYKLCRAGIAAFPTPERAVQGLKAAMDRTVLSDGSGQEEAA